MADTGKKSPIKSGWRGHLSGHVAQTSSRVEVSEITLKLDHITAWALCNHLSDAALDRAAATEGSATAALSELGAALGRLIDHHSANNGGRQILMP